MISTLPPANAVNTAEKIFATNSDFLVVVAETCSQSTFSTTSYNFDENEIVFNIMFQASKCEYPIPRKNALDSVIQTIKIAKDHSLDVKSFAPTYEGGIEAEFNLDDKYLHIEFFDSEYASLFIEELGQTSIGWDLNSNDILDKFREVISK